MDSQWLSLALATKSVRSRRGMSYRMLSFLGGRLCRPVVTVPLVVEYEKSLCDPRTEVPFSAEDIRNSVTSCPEFLTSLLIHMT